MMSILDQFVGRIQSQLVSRELSPLYVALVEDNSDTVQPPPSQLFTVQTENHDRRMHMPCLVVFVGILSTSITITPISSPVSIPVPSVAVVMADSRPVIVPSPAILSITVSFSSGTSTAAPLA
jgi:hypothetical protein